MQRRSFLWLTLLVAIVATASGCSTYITSRTVFDLFGFSGVVPYPSYCGGYLCGSLLSQSSCLGHNGPIGASGPVGSLGPVGSNIWNPAIWISGLYDWSTFSQNISGMGGPLSAAGPLGSNGPLGTYYYTVVMPSFNDFAKHLAGHGIWTILGPIGPLGAAGLLGPLGPVGAHGYLRNATGDYLNSTGAVVRSVVVPYNSSTSRTWPLFEYYSAARAKQLGLAGQQDTSFMVENSVYGSSIDAYIFNVTSVPQYVSLLVVPGVLWDPFTLRVTNMATNTVIFSAQVTSMVNWAQMYVTSVGRYKAEVFPMYSDTYYHPYRLLVTGSTNYIPKSAIVGPYIKTC